MHGNCITIRKGEDCGEVEKYIMMMIAIFLVNKANVQGVNLQNCTQHAHRRPIHVSYDSDEEENIRFAASNISLEP